MQYLEGFARTCKQVRKTYKEGTVTGYCLDVFHVGIHFLIPSPHPGFARAPRGSDPRAAFNGTGPWIGGLRSEVFLMVRAQRSIFDVFFFEFEI